MNYTEKDSLKAKNKSRNNINCVSNYDHSLANPCRSKYSNAKWRKFNIK